MLASAKPSSDITGDDIEPPSWNSNVSAAAVRCKLVTMTTNFELTLEDWI